MEQKSLFENKNNQLKFIVTYYHPTEQGLEVKYKNKLEQIKAWKKSHNPNQSNL